MGYSKDRSEKSLRRDNMKILYLLGPVPSSLNDYRGIYTLKRIEKLREINVDIYPIAITVKKSFVEKFFAKDEANYKEKVNFLKSVNIDSLIVNSYSLDFLIKILSNKAFYDLRHRRIIKKILKIIPKDFDLIHAHSVLSAGLLSRILSRILEKPYIVTAHGDDIHNYPFKNQALKKITLEVLENSYKNIFVSRGLLEKSKEFGFEGKNSIIIPNGYDPKIFYPIDKEKIRKELGIYKRNYRYVGFVGNLIPVKRADKLPEIFEMISKKYDNIIFIIVGDGYLKEEVEKEMSQKNLSYIFTGKLLQKDVAKWMNAMDVMVLPSRNEGWPCVVLEAQACGTCVLGSSNGGISEAIGFPEYIVEEGKNFEERFAKKVIEILEKGYNREQLLKRAKEYTWDNIVKKEIEIYEGLRYETIK